MNALGAKSLAKRCRDRVLAVIKHKDATPAEVATTLFISREVARRHLRALCSDGAAYRRFAPDPETGAPDYIYSVIPPEFRKRTPEQTAACVETLVGDWDATRMPSILDRRNL